MEKVIRLCQLVALWNPVTEDLQLLLLMVQSCQRPWTLGLDDFSVWMKTQDLKWIA